MASRHVDVESAEWTPGTPFYGPAATDDDGKAIVKLKILSDRRGEGGGIAWLAKFSPPPMSPASAAMTLIGGSSRSRRWRRRP